MGADTGTSATGAQPRLLQVWVDQDLCTGDGICVQDAPDLFELDIDGLAYVKDASGELLTEPGARVDVPAGSVRDVLASAKECPGRCIHVVRDDGVVVGGPDRQVEGGEPSST